MSLLELPLFQMACSFGRNIFFMTRKEMYMLKDSICRSISTHICTGIRDLLLCYFSCLFPVLTSGSHTIHVAGALGICFKVGGSVRQYAQFIARMEVEARMEHLPH